VVGSGSKDGPAHLELKEKKTPTPRQKRMVIESYRRERHTKIWDSIEQKTPKADPIPSSTCWTKHVRPLSKTDPLVRPSDYGDQSGVPGLPQPSRCAALGEDSKAIKQAREYSCVTKPCTCCSTSVEELALPHDDENKSVRIPRAPLGHRLCAEQHVPSITYAAF